MRGSAVEFFACAQLTELTQHPTPAWLSGRGWNMSTGLSVDSQSDRTSWAMKSSKTGSLSDSRRPRGPRVLGYTSLQLNTVTETGEGERVPAAKHRELKNKCPELIMCHGAHLRAQPAAVLFGNPLKVAKTPAAMLPSCCWP